MVANTCGHPFVYFTVTRLKNKGTGISEGGPEMRKFDEVKISRISGLNKLEELIYIM